MAYLEVDIAGIDCDSEAIFKAIELDKIQTKTTKTFKTEIQFFRKKSFENLQLKG